EAYGLGVNYLGVCCGAAPIHIREAAEAVGRTPEASRFSENMANHFMYGSNERPAEHVVELGGRGRRPRPPPACRAHAGALAPLPVRAPVGSPGGQRPAIQPPQAPHLPPPQEVRGGVAGAAVRRAR